MLRRGERNAGGLLRAGHPRGAALLEVLVSILLSATALLALASVNAAALRLGKMSQHRANAALLALDIGERMRANKAGFEQGNYAFSVALSGQGLVAAPTLVCQASTSLCSAADMATLDLAQWRWLSRQLLPQGAVFVQTQTLASMQGAADIWLVWQEPAPASLKASGSVAESPRAAGECPDGLGVSTDLSVRCSHLRVHL